MGLDLGQSTNPASAAVLDKIDREPPGLMGPPNPNFRPRLDCVSLKIWPLGTDYQDIVDDAINLPCHFMVVDFGGVGRPVVDMLRRQAQLKHYPGKIRPVQLIGSLARASRKQEARGSHWNIPKVDVVNSITQAQQQMWLSLPDMPETQVLLNQLRDFKMKYTKAANLQFGATTTNDDIVIGLGLACWYALNYCRNAAIFV